jgi:hypothetical protein
MDEATATEILERLERLETKVDTVVTFTGTLKNLVGAWMSGGRGKLLTTLAKVKGGDGT